MTEDRLVRAKYDDHTITVYQAYTPQIANAALAAGTFVPPFKRDRMTWIKPSFLWMMYRSGWAAKPGQERILKIEITRTGFEWALAHSSLSHFDHAVYDNEEEWRAVKEGSPVRVQWDPERSITLEPLKHRAIQIGLSREAVNRYVEQWIVAISDVTKQATEIASKVARGELDEARAALPAERSYPLPEEARLRVGATEIP